MRDKTKKQFIPPTDSDFAVKKYQQSRVNCIEKKRASRNRNSLLKRITYKRRFNVEDK